MSFSCHVVLCNLGWCRVTSLLSFSWGAAFLFSVTSDSWAIWDDTLLTASVKTLSSLFRHISSFDTIGNFNSSDIVWGLAISKWLFMSLCKVPMMAIWTKSCSKISICLALSWRPMTKRLNDSSWRCFAANSSAFNMCFCCSVGAKRNFSAEITLSKVGLVTERNTSLASPVSCENNTDNFSSSCFFPIPSQYRLTSEMKSDRYELPSNVSIFNVKTLSCLQIFSMMATKIYTFLWHKNKF